MQMQTCVERQNLSNTRNRFANISVHTLECTKTHTPLAKHKGQYTEMRA